MTYGQVMDDGRQRLLIELMRNGRCHFANRHHARRKQQLVALVDLITDRRLARACVGHHD